MISFQDGGTLEQDQTPQLGNNIQNQDCLKVSGKIVFASIGLIMISLNTHSKRSHK